MSVEQSSNVNAIGKLGLFDLGWVVPGTIRAGFELAVARTTLNRIGPKDIAARNSRFGVKSDPASTLTAQQQRIIWLIPRIAKRVPWRSDCLVQAIAAQNWLGSIGRSSQIVVGVQKAAESGFGSHAWLECGGEIILGQNDEEYTRIIDIDPAKH